MKNNLTTTQKTEVVLAKGKSLLSITAKILSGSKALATKEGDESDPYQKTFDTFVKKIYDRNYDLGTCFEKNITFKSFESNQLTWESIAEDLDKKTLNAHWGLINMFIKDRFGFETKIVNISKKVVETVQVVPSIDKDIEPDISSDSHKDITIIGDLMWENVADPDENVLDWDDAMEYAKNLRLGGYDDWRLPTIDELKSVIKECGGAYATWDDESYQANYKAKGFASNLYWSSTTDAGYIGGAWDVGFDNGSQGYDDKISSFHVRCVRAGQ